MAQTKRSKRFQVLENRPVHKDGFIGEWVDVGLIAMGSPNDPAPSIKIEGGKIVEMDGVRREDFNMNEQFVADYAIDIEMAPKAMAMSEREIAHMLVDINVPRQECTKIMQGLTPAKIARTMDCLNIAEIIIPLKLAWRQSKFFTKTIRTPMIGSSSHFWTSCEMNGQSGMTIPF